MKLYNTLTRQLEDFKPLNPPEVTLYTCGPTVYHYAHIGNLRAYIAWDTLKRTLQAKGYDVKHVMNITDVGHLTSDADSGEDKMQKGARREGKTAWEVAEYYTKAFLQDLQSLNIQSPSFQPKATEYIAEQIEMVRQLEEKGYTYKTSSGIAYDTSKFTHYNKLSHLDLEQLKEGARVEADPEKEHPTDFYLWKFSPQDEKRDMEWDSPWGVGFPGWHIECSAMAFSLLGQSIDIHTGGIDHINVHHSNEIAQSEAVSGKQFAKYWLHNNFIVLKNSVKMAKSGENFLRLESITEKGFDPLAYRYMCLTAHYRSELEFSWDSMHVAQHTLNRLRQHSANKTTDDILETYYQDFLDHLSNDLDTPKALATMHEMIATKDAKVPATLQKMNELLGLDLGNSTASIVPHDSQIEALLHEREEARKNKEWQKADELRQKIKDAGFEIEDTPTGAKLKKAHNY